MANALIGFTGLVGGTLLHQAPFDDLYNSRNIESIADNDYRLIVCAGAPAQKWLANREPVADRQNLQRLMDALAHARADRVILISTVDVFPLPVAVDEDTVIDRGAQHPYGKHRLELEEFLTARFPTLVVRLPALFGRGLKKNIIYDFLHHNEVSKIHTQSAFQFYNLEWLWGDLETASRHNLALVHLATEPLTVRDIAVEAFGWDFTNQPPAAPARYDFRSKWAAHYGGRDGYLYTRRQVLDGLQAFVQSERRNLHATGDLESRLAS